MKGRFKEQTAVLRNKGLWGAAAMFGCPPVVKPDAAGSIQKRGASWAAQNLVFWVKITIFVPVGFCSSPEGTALSQPRRPRGYPGDASLSERRATLGCGGKRRKTPEGVALGSLR